MQNKVVIEVEKLSKSYQLGNIGWNTFWNDCRRYGSKIGLPFSTPKYGSQFNALDEVSFGVKQEKFLELLVQMEPASPLYSKF